jgi:hypothetical protein
MIAGESVGACRVNSSAKLFVSSSLHMFGLNGGCIRLCSKSSHLVLSKKACVLTSAAPCAPSRLLGTLISSLSIKSLVFLEKKRGTGGCDLSIRFEMSAGMFFSPSTVKGDAPVSSSYASTPKLHQSTVYERERE